MKTRLDLPHEEFLSAAEQICVLLKGLRDARDEAPVLCDGQNEDPPPAPEDGPPKDGLPLGDLLEEIRRSVIPYCRRNDSPRFFGYVCSGGSDAGTLADFLASGLNQNVTAWRSAPSATDLERLVVDWIRGIVGMPEGSAGLLLGGGTMATLTALAAARDSLAGADVAAGGLITLGREMTLYASDEVHMSVPRAASLLGLGRQALRVLASRDDCTMDMDTLGRAVEADRREGRLPFCVVANAGSTATGAVDPLAEMAAFCRREKLWLHVDAAYGGFAALAPSASRRLEGLGEADSVSVDPHKWIHVPFDCGAVLVRNPAALRAPFTEVGSYARTSESSRRTAFTFFEQGPELSRRFRALKVWMVMKHLGTGELARMIDHDILLAGRLAAMIGEAADMELLAPAPLSTVCFRYAPGGNDEGDLDGLNRAILRRLQGEAKVYPTHAQVKGRFAIRACILNPRSTYADAGILVSETRRHGRAILNRAD
jgi:glutamate/tyrosine decarboxylase-like PLP-dependent enzyme